MCGESSVAKEFTVQLASEGVMAGAIVFPMSQGIKRMNLKCQQD